MAEGLKQTSHILGYSQYTATDTAFSLADTPAVGHGFPPTDPSQYGARPFVALIQAEEQNIRWRDDGVAPTVSTGMILYAGDQPFLYDGDLRTIKFIAVISGAILNVSYYR